ncbi:hypothetical protein IQ268_28170 [Oculatella sp. LEGE 06141]|uniref:hypothetical protein n=1 Tax=Oculatella sp. LEGE 06141 TaxID=1828648 RepID=UPI00187DFC84|nr:hypothetical protein [Oculatella sp. LEGE 06141]MBE9182429.1 hypothetical protein [Oculatella sp. LEGE 06141]
MLNQLKTSGNFCIQGLQGSYDRIGETFHYAILLDQDGNTLQGTAPNLGEMYDAVQEKIDRMGAWWALEDFLADLLDVGKIDFDDYSRLVDF